MATVRRDILDAYLRLLGRESFDAVTMPRIAAEAGISLPELRGEVESELTLFEGFAALVDRGVLEQAPRPMPDKTPQQRLFDVLMTRLAVLTPYRPVIWALKDAARRDPGLGALFNGISAREQSWMLVAAGIDVRGPKARNIAEALVYVFAATVEAWLGEEDGALPRTRETLAQQLQLSGGWLAELDLLSRAGKQPASGTVN
jgi:AcrR family transcriptional regulator